jgi:plastocyanin
MPTTTEYDITAGWRRLAAIAAITWLAWAIALTAIIGELEPFILLFGLIPVAAWGLTLWKPRRWAYIVFGALGLLAILMNLPFVISDLSHPESAVGFNIGLVALLAALLQTLVGVTAIRPLSARLATGAWRAAAGVFAVGLVISGIAAAGLEDDQPSAGDIRIDAHKVTFSPGSISAPSGTVALFVENRDPGRHTFTIEALDVDLELPANTSRRVEFTAPAGTYTIICAVPGHESMTGTLVVGG